MLTRPLSHGPMPLTPLLALLALAPARADDPPVASTSAALLIDRAVAVVGARVLTASELRLSLALARHDLAPLSFLAPGDQGAEDWWIEQVILRELAGDISVYQPDPAAVRERTERLLDQLGPEERATLERTLGADREAIASWVHARMVVERFVVRNLGTLPEPEARAAYQQWLEEQRGRVAVRRIPAERR